MTTRARVTLAFAIAAIALGLVSMAAVPAKAASVPYNLYGSATSGWGLTTTSETNPGPSLSANAGDTVTITLHSTDGFAHQLLIDYNGNGIADAGEPVSAQFTTTTTLTFTATQAGTFHYLCTIHGSAMTGTFTVQGTGSPSPSSSSSTTLLIVGIVIGVVVIAGVSVLVLRSRK
jgi:plastocyanin